MGMFGRFKEKVHEVAPGHFQATSSDRIDKMFKEVHDYAQLLKECEKQIKLLETATTGVFNASKAALTSPLPHVYQTDVQGNSVAVLAPEELRQEAAANLQTGTNVSAGSVKVAELDQISNYHNQQLESNVLAPLRQWIAAYRAFKDKMKTLDNTRLEFDAERRAFSKLDIKRVRQQQAADKIEPELAGKLEAKSGDVAAKRNVYQAHEEELYRSLSALINDAKNTRVYLASTMRLHSQTFGTALYG